VQTPVRLILESRAALMGAAAYAEARAAEISGHSERARSCKWRRLKAVSNYCGLTKIREELVSLGENHERVLGSPGFPARGANRGQRGAAFIAESRMQFDGTTKLHRKSGFGLHQLRKPL